jgi:peptide deformylase
MALLEIRLFPDPVLRKVTEPVEDFGPDLQKLVRNMVETMYAEPGVGLAAPQVGVSLRLFVTDGVLFGAPEGSTLVFANAEILSAEGEQTSEEGCLSFPGVYEPVTRPMKCKVRAQDASGRPFEMECEGLPCRAIFHEVDHCEGRLIIDYLSPLKRQIVRKEAKKGFPNRVKGDRTAEVG